VTIVSNPYQPFCNSKLISATFKNLIGSRAVPFGIIALYGDQCLQQMIQMGYMITMNVQPIHLQCYQKLASIYYGFWASMTADYLPSLCASMTEPLFEHILFTCYKTIETEDNSISSHALTIVNQIFTHSIESKSFFGCDPLKEHRKLLQLVFTRVFIQDLETQWSFTRPFLPLILFDLEFFMYYLNHLESLQQEGEKVHKVLVGLVDGVGKDLGVKNRDLFTRTIDTAKRQIQQQGLGLTFLEI
jgi:exportin-7